MKIKISEATPHQLDWLVAKCEGLHPPSRLTTAGQKFSRLHAYSIDPAQSVPIIEREGILVRFIRCPGHPLHGKCLAMYDGTNTGTMVQWVKRESWHRHYFEGPTMLIAAMRCFVASRLGEEVKVPEELLP